MIRPVFAHAIFLMMIGSSAFAWLALRSIWGKHQRSLTLRQTTEFCGSHEGRRIRQADIDETFERDGASMPYLSIVFSSPSCVVRMVSHHLRFVFENHNLFLKKVAVPVSHIGHHEFH